MTLPLLDLIRSTPISFGIATWFRDGVDAEWASRFVFFGCATKTVVIPRTISVLGKLSFSLLAISSFSFESGSALTQIE
jgi:hypothetical protein